MLNFWRNFRNLFRKKWRDDGLGRWNTEAASKLRREIMDCIEYLKTGNNIDIIVCGGLGCGKSSFVNNCMTALSEQVCHIAEAGDGDYHITKWVFQSYTYENGEQNKLPLRFCDTRGISSGRDGASLAAIEACILGKVENKEEMNQREDWQWEDRRPVRNKVSYILFVADATHVPDDPSDECSQAGIYRQLRELRTFAIKEEIPVAAILTKCDMVEEEVGENVSNLQYSDIVMTKVRSFSSLFKMQENRVFPVKNYTGELNTSSEMMIQTLIALKACLSDIRSQKLANEDTISNS